MLPCNTITLRLQFADFCEEIVIKEYAQVTRHQLSLVHFAGAAGTAA
jgi:hypothetical protein